MISIIDGVALVVCVALGLAAIWLGDNRFIATLVLVAFTMATYHGLRTARK